MRSPKSSNGEDKGYKDRGRDITRKVYFCAVNEPAPNCGLDSQAHQWRDEGDGDENNPVEAVIGR